MDREHLTLARHTECNRDMDKIKSFNKTVRGDVIKSIQIYAKRPKVTLCNRKSEELLSPSTNKREGLQIFLSYLETIGFS